MLGNRIIPSYCVITRESMESLTLGKIGLASYAESKWGLNLIEKPDKQAWVTDR